MPSIPDQNSFRVTVSKRAGEAAVPDSGKNVSEERDLIGETDFVLWV